MGQYYMAYVSGEVGEYVFCPQNAIYMTKNGLHSDKDITTHSYDMENPNSWGSNFSGLKLMEHGWLQNDFVNGVVEEIEDFPCRVAWVGDYADDQHDFGDYYTEFVYMRTWGDNVEESPFDCVPEVHTEGFLVNCDKKLFIDLKKYAETSSYEPSWDKGRKWCIHPLPRLTAIGNGRGGGDYEGSCMDMVGSWAMDLIEFTRENPTDATEVDYASYTFVEKE